jgi:hypothetical protein
MLKILYVVQSCDNYVDTRCLSSEQTWLKQINQESDYIILTANSNKSKTFSTRTRDDYWSLPDKWTKFLSNYNFDNYDWVFCIDDDNFVFPDRLEKYIIEQNFDHNKNQVIGSRHCEFRQLNDVIFCGGGGILMSISSIKKLKDYIPTDEFSINHLCHDCFMFDLFKRLNLEIINSNVNGDCGGPFYAGKLDNPCLGEENLNTAVSLHYCNSENKENLYKKYYL